MAQDPNKICAFGRIYWERANPHGSPGIFDSPLRILPLSSLGLSSLQGQAFCPWRAARQTVLLRSLSVAAGRNMWEPDPAASYAGTGPENPSLRAASEGLSPETAPGLA